MPLDETTREALNACALRFDGWRFAERRGDDQVLATLSDRFVTTLCASPDPDEDLAAFFALQRFLHKWGGERLPESSRVVRAFRMLFLHLYRAEIAPDLRDPEGWRRWQERYADRAEEFAAEVRRDLLRVRRRSAQKG